MKCFKHATCEVYKAKAGYYFSGLVYCYNCKTEREPGKDNHRHLCDRCSSKMASSKISELWLEVTELFPELR